MANKEQMKGKARELGGSAQEQIGAATGDEDLEARGAANRTRGKAEGAVGKVKKTAEHLKDAVTGH